MSSRCEAELLRWRGQLGPEFSEYVFATTNTQIFLIGTIAFTAAGCPRRSVGQSLAALFDSGSNGPRRSLALESDWGAGGAGSGAGSGVGSGARSGAGCGIGSGCWIGCCADPRSFTD